jgi:hypothetical protein
MPPCLCQLFLHRTASLCSLPASCPDSTSGFTSSSPHTTTVRRFQAHSERDCPPVSLQRKFMQVITGRLSAFLVGKRTRMEKMIIEDTHDPELKAITASSLITTIHKSPQHSAVSSPAISWQRLLTLEIPQLHKLKSSLNGSSLPTVSFPHRLP